MSALAGIAELPEDVIELDHYYGDPHTGVRANMITTLDGGAAFNGRTKPVTDPADQVLLAHLRSYADVVLVGSATVAAENYGPVKLSQGLQDKRVKDGHAALPRLAVVTARGALSPDLRIFSGDVRPLIVTTRQTAGAQPALADLGDIVIAGDAAVDPTTAIAGLREAGLERVLCEGGPYLLSTLVDDNLVDDMCLTVAPYLTGLQPTTPQSTSSLAEPTRLELRHVLTKHGLLYLRYSRP
ncbi:MAG TPA: pyrimidine reductase family protein [Mycobacteriales bacterium]|jgi:riboflavin biosynthesis pyrimidine reductase|nr:pyrimidine reductase family protein [Mycobacteriales bacterium]